MHTHLKATEQEYALIYNEINEKEAKLKQKQAKIHKQKEAAKQQKDLLTKYQYLIRNVDGANNGMYYKCSQCIEKIFITKGGLVNHYQEMHSSKVPDTDLEPMHKIPNNEKPTSEKHRKSHRKSLKEETKSDKTE